jgi:hypothetical protein
MAQDTNLLGGTSSVRQDVDATNNAQVILPGYNAAGVAVGGGDANGLAIFSELDNGSVGGARKVLSPETDTDFRLRVAHDNFLDQETFTDTAQNTGKFSHAFTTLTATESAAGLLTNSGNITTTTTGMTFGTFAMFPVGGTQTLVCETTLSFTAQPNANQIVDFGVFMRGATTAFAPLDGVYFRLTSAGLFGVINSNGTETTSAVFPLSGGTGTYVYANNAASQYLIQANNVNTTFWIDNVLYATIPTPVGLGFPCMSRALPWSIRHAIVGGTAGSALQCIVKDYRVLARGTLYSEPLGNVGGRVYGTYQGLSGGTMGQLVAGTVTTGTLVKPTAAVPLNASLAANLPNSLGGRINEALTAGLAVNTDGLFASFTVPAGTTAVQGRRLKVNGLKLSATVSTVVVGGPVTTEFYIAFGHTADSLATTESASFATGTTKAPRRIMLPELTQTVTAAQAVDTKVNQVSTVAVFTNPIYVNPGERIALVGNKTATVAATAGVISHVYQFDYTWE